MSTIHELGAAVRVRRSDMGLTQGTLAKLSGLSRTTINQVETGNLQNLSLNRASQLASVLGMNLTISEPRTRGTKRAEKSLSALEKAAIVASTSYKKLITAGKLQGLLLHVDVSTEFLPHVRALLEEAPTSLLADVVEQLHAENGIERSELWGRMKKIARSVHSYRELWQ
jgi:transcriptional regulator with XRE-family HTH domain